MRQSIDNDVQFRVDLGRIHNNIIEIELQQAVIENKFMNFYDTQQGDFRDLSFRTGGVTYSIRIDQYLTVDTISSFIRSKSGVVMTLVYDNNTAEGTLFPTTALRLMIKSVIPSIQLIGFGWTKLGFEQTTYNVLDNRIRASRLPDFSQPPLILIDVAQFQGCLGTIGNRYGQHAFVIPVQNQFGDRIFWTNTNQESNQSITFKQPTSIQFLDISLLSCDQKPMTTPSDSSGIINNQDLEVILVMTISSLV